MQRRKQKVFASPREVFETYFPKYLREENGVQPENGYSPSCDVVGKLADDFAATLRKKNRRASGAGLSGKKGAGLCTRP